MSNSAIPAAVRAVVAAFTANLPPEKPVLVGPGVTDTGATGYVFVGANDPNAPAEEEAVTGSQAWAQLGGGKRDETFVIHCCMVAWNGDGDQLAAMDDAFASMGAIETALTTDPSLSKALLYAPGITSLGLKFDQTNKGAVAYLPFDLDCRSRI